jgi:hypothetical protein
VDIPPQYQLLSALIIGVLVAIGAAYRFFADLRRAPERDHMRSFAGAGLGEVVTELREMRSVMQRHLDTDRTDQLVKAIERVADEIAHADLKRPRTRT